MTGGARIDPYDDLKPDPSLQQTAELEDCHVNTIRKRIDNGEYRSYLDGRIRRVERLSIMERRKGLRGASSVSPTLPPPPDQAKIAAAKARRRAAKAFDSAAAQSAETTSVAALDVPQCLEKLSPWAAEEARRIASGQQSALQRARLDRLINTQRAWQSIGKRTSPLEAVIWHPEILRVAYSAPDEPKRTKAAITDHKKVMAAIGRKLITYERPLRQVAEDAPHLALQVSDVINLYKVKHRDDDDVVQTVPDDVSRSAALLGHLGRILVAEDKITSQRGVVRRGSSPDAERQAVVVRLIGEVVRGACRTPLYGAVAALASASLDVDIDVATVRKLLA